MAPMLNLQGFGGSRGASRFASAQPEPPSSFLASIGRAGAPEPPLTVEFTGLTASEQRLALGGFPGGKRFVLAVPHKQAS